MLRDSQAIMVVDLAFGDSGKGTVVDFLARQIGARAVVRFNGGPQAGHNVVTPDGRQHTFSQLGSGTFVPGVRTLLSRFMLVEPYALLNEADHLRRLGVGDALERLSIHRDCAVITPCHQAANRLCELARGDGAHGTCGLGIGQTMQDLVDHPELTLRAADLADGGTVARKLRAFRDLKLDQLRAAIGHLRDDARARRDLETLEEPTWIEVAIETYREVADRVELIDDAIMRKVLNACRVTIFEGAQGVLLDEWFGFHPHTTWSTTTFANAETLLDGVDFVGRRVRLGVLRSYFTRHGAGPLVTEDPALRAALPEPHNADTGWQGRFRVGPFDAVAARYALRVAGGVDALAITHLDRLARLPAHLCTAYHPPASSKGLFARNELRMRTPADLAHQQRLTGALRDCRAVYTPVETGDARVFLAQVARELKSKIALASFGPTANDKRLMADGLTVAGSSVPDTASRSLVRALARP
jgi:adenylosuccinate synthase